MRGAPCWLLTSLFLLCGGPVAAQDPASAAPRLPAYRGEVERFRLSPGGAIEGLLLTDGTEVETPPHLSVQMGTAIRPGDTVTVHGLRAASLPLVQAVSVSDDRTGRTVVDRGQSAPPGSFNPADGSALARREGRIRMLMHGPRGEVDGLLLDDGTTVRIDAIEPAQLPPAYRPGSLVVVEGDASTTPYGTVIRARAIGARLAGSPPAPSP